jgi:hypothetical protein
MKTNLKNLIENDKFNVFWFRTSNGDIFPSSEVEVGDDDTVNLSLVGYVGKDVDGLDKWEVNGSGDGFTMKGSFYNEQDYDGFVKSISKQKQTNEKL